jgi:hypothetical protein
MDNHLNFVDGVSGLVVLAAIGKILPPLAAALSIVWYGIRIYEWYKNKNRKD